MKWFEKLFSKKDNHNNNDQSFNIMEDLFVDNNPPQSEIIPQEKSISSITSFLNQDYFLMGYNDGYRNHSDEILKSTSLRIKADFRMQIDMIIDQKRNKRLEMMNMQAETGRISESLNQQIANICRDLDESIETLKTEKQNSVDDEGWVMKAIHKYREGFIKGTGKYQEEKLLAISTGLFN